MSEPQPSAMALRAVDIARYQIKALRAAHPIECDTLYASLVEVVIELNNRLADVLGSGSPEQVHAAVSTLAEAYGSLVPAQSFLWKDDV